MKHFAIWLIKLYKKFISPALPPACRFTPTCSEYAIEAFRKRGFFVGLILTVWRLLRCNPFCRGGYDPVPDVGLVPECRKKGYKAKTEQQSASCEDNRGAQEDTHRIEENDADENSPIASEPQASDDDIDEKAKAYKNADSEQNG